MSPADARKAWARQHIRSAPEAPAYGSREWLALPDGPEKVAAVVRAAECWASDGDELLDRLRHEVEHAARAHKSAEDAEYVARAREHSHDWTGRGFRPDPALPALVEAEWNEWRTGAPS